MQALAICHHLTETKITYYALNPWAEQLRMVQEMDKGLTRQTAALVLELLAEGKIPNWGSAQLDVDLMRLVVDD